LKYLQDLGSSISELKIDERIYVRKRKDIRVKLQSFAISRDLISYWRKIGRQSGADRLAGTGKAGEIPLSSFFI
jgi:hypothetical protein